MQQDAKIQYYVLHLDDLYVRIRVEAKYIRIFVSSLLLSGFPPEMLTFFILSVDVF
jgi:hypothetical protein